jgi:hypothetical protein
MRIRKTGRLSDTSKIRLRIPAVPAGVVSMTNAKWQNKSTITVRSKISGNITRESLRVDSQDLMVSNEVAG